MNGIFRHFRRLLGVTLLVLIVGKTAVPAETSFFVPDPEIRDVAGHQELWVTTVDGPPQKLGDVEIIAEGTKFYSWQGFLNSSHWIAQGRLSEQDIKTLDDSVGDAAGGGLYESADIWDSSEYGPQLVVITTTQPVKALTNLTGDHLIAEMNAWNPFDEKLRALGLDGVGRFGGNKTWFVFFDTKALLHITAGTWRDFEESDYFKHATVDLDKVLEVNTKIPLEATPWIKSHFPYLEQILNRSITPSQLDPEVRKELMHHLIYESKAEDHSPLSLSMRAIFRPDLVAEFKSSYQQELHPKNSPDALKPEWVRTGNQIESRIKFSRELGMPYSLWLPRVDQPAPIFPSVGPSDHLRSPRLPRTESLDHHLEYMDIDDFLSAVAQGRSVDSAYDTPGASPYLDRWTAAKRAYSSAGVLEAHRALTGDSGSGYRDGPASSDGDILWQGKRYFEVNAKQILALKKNPFIRLELERIPDPGNSRRKIRVARYDYPTAQDFEKLEGYLSAPMEQKLREAKAAGLLANVGAPQTRALTKAMIEDLMKGLSESRFFFPAADKKLFILSVHPFESMNTEISAVVSTASSVSGKKFYRGNRTTPGRPDEPLLVTRETYHALIQEGAINDKVIQQAFERAERENPASPNYFDVPEIWQVGRGIADIGPDEKTFVAESKAFYSSDHSPGFRHCLMKNVDESFTGSRGKSKL